MAAPHWVQRHSRRGLGVGQMIVQEAASRTGAHAIRIALDALADEDLVRQVATGSHAAFAVLARRHTGRALAIARGFQLGAAEQEDIAQEAMVRLWRSAARFDPGRGARFSTWFHRIVANLCIDRIRQPAGVALDGIQDPVEDRPSAFVTVAERQSAAILATAIAGLAERQRAVLALCYYEECTAGEAGAILGMTTGAVEVTLSRTRKQLRRRLAQRGLRTALVE